MTLPADTSLVQPSGTLTGAANSGDVGSDGGGGGGGTYTISVAVATGTGLDDVDVVVLGNSTRSSD